MDDARPVEVKPKERQVRVLFRLSPEPVVDAYDLLDRCYQGVEAIARDGAFLNTA